MAEIEKQIADRRALIAKATAVDEQYPKSTEFKRMMMEIDALKHRHDERADNIKKLVGPIYIPGDSWNAGK